MVERQAPPSDDTASGTASGAASGAGARTEAPPGPHVLFDVTTCHYNRGRVMTGIPRVELNLAAAIAEALGDAVTFLRYDAKTGEAVIEPAATVLAWGREAPTEKLGRSETGIFARSRVLAAIASRHSPVRRLGRALERGVRKGRRRLWRALGRSAPSGGGAVAPLAGSGAASGTTSGAVNGAASTAALAERLAGLGGRPLVFLHVGADWLAAEMLALIRRAAGGPVEARVLVHDLLPLDFPEFYPEDFRRRFAAYVEDFVVPADRHFAYSDYTRGRLAARAGLAPERVTRVHLPTDMSALKDIEPSPVAAVAARGEPFFLTVGVVSMRKNQAFLVDVWQQGLTRGQAMPLLVIAGSLLSSGDAYPLALYRRVQADPALRDRIVFVENASDAELVWLYRSCQGFLFPSLAEGWGLPVTEALAFGKPCLISDRTAVPEAGMGRAVVLEIQHQDWLDHLFTGPTKITEKVSSEHIRYSWKNVISDALA